MSSLENNFFWTYNELSQFLKVLVSINFHVTVRYNFQGPYLTFTNCSLNLNHCKVNLYSFIALHSFPNPLASFVHLSTQIFLSQFVFVIIVENARTVSFESFVFILFASTVLSNRSWRTSPCQVHAPNNIFECSKCFHSLEFNVTRVNFVYEVFEYKDRLYLTWICIKDIENRFPREIEISFCARRLYPITMYLDNTRFQQIW